MSFIFTNLLPILTVAGLIVSLVLLSLLIPPLRRKAAEEKQKRAQEAEKKAEEIKKKIGIIKGKGGLLAKEVDKISHRSDNTLEILYIAATQQDIRFDLATERREQVVPYPTATMDYVQVTDVSQLPLISPDQAILDDDVFYQKFVTQELMRPEYSDPVDKFKRLYILLDASGSMSAERYKMQDGRLRETWARGVVASLLMDAIEGRAEYLLRLFAGDVYDLHSAATPEEAEKLLSWMIEQSFSGSHTNIGNAVRTAAQDIRELQAKDRRIVHILLITDGEDTVGLTREHLVEALAADVKLHVVLIGTSWGKDHPLTPYVIAKY